MIKTIEKNGKDAKKKEQKVKKKVNILDALNAHDSAPPNDQSSAAYHSPVKRSLK